MNNEKTIEYNNDEEIIKLIRNGDNKSIEILINRYDSIIKGKSKKYFIIGGDQNDVYQEAMIGLYTAIKNYNLNGDTTFRTFADLCIERQLITAIKGANRQKNKLLNNAISLSVPYEQDAENSHEIINSIKNEKDEDPLNIIVKNELFNYMKETLYNDLSKKETDVLNEYIKGHSYNKIAENLDCDVKSVDTALTRIRRKAIKIKENMNKI